MSKPWRRGGSREGRRREFDDEYDGAPDNNRRGEKNKGKPLKRSKNEKVLLDILAEDPDAEEELVSQ